MNFLEVIRKDEEIKKLKKFISENGGFVPGFGFWDGETVDEYRIRLRKIAEEINHENKAQS